METQVTAHINTNPVGYTIHLTTSDTPAQAMKLMRDAIEAKPVEKIEATNTGGIKTNYVSPICTHGGGIKFSENKQVAACDRCGLILTANQIRNRIGQYDWRLHNHPSENKNT